MSTVNRYAELVSKHRDDLIKLFGAAYIEAHPDKPFEMANRELYADEIEEQRQLNRPMFQRDESEICPVCHGTGFVWVGECFEDRPGYSYVVRCKCFDKLRAMKRVEKSGLSDVLKEMTFQSFQAQEDWQKSIAQAATSYANTLIHAAKGDKLPWFYIGGQSGCGKTHICTAICEKLLNEGFDVRYALWTKDIRELKAHIMELDFEKLLEPFVTVKVLYLDDVFKPTGNAEATDADIRLLFEIVNQRYTRNLPTIFSSELLLRQFSAIDEATGSRVSQRADGYTLGIGQDKTRNWRLHHP